MKIYYISLESRLLAKKALLLAAAPVIKLTMLKSLPSLFEFQLQVSSSEFFTVNFECLDDLRDRGYEEFVPATRGTCLR